MKKVFKSFAGQEEEHRDKLTAIRKGDRTFVFKHHLFPKIHLLDIPVDEANVDNLSVEDAVALAMKREKASYRLYLEMAAEVEDKALVDIFVSLAHEEANHRLQLEIEYDKVIAMR